MLKWIFLGLAVAGAGLALFFKQLGGMPKEMYASGIVGGVFLVLWIASAFRDMGNKKPPTVGPPGSEYKRHQGLKLN